MNYRTLQPSPYAQSNRQGQVSDPVSKLLDLLKPVVNHVTKSQPQQTQGFDPNTYAKGYEDQYNQANTAYGAANTAYDQSAGAYRNALTAPRPAMPQQTPALGQKEAGWAAGLGGLAMLLGARPQFVQQGIQGYTGTRENQAQMGYANQVNDYNAKNDQFDRELQGLQLDLNDKAHHRDIAHQALVMTGGNLEEAKKLIESHKMKKSMDDTQTQNNMLEFAGRNIKDTASANRFLALAEKAGPVSDEIRQAVLEQGAEGDRQLKQKGLDAAYRIKITNTADAKRAAARAGAKPGTPEYDGFIEIGREAEDFYNKYHMSDAEKREFWEYQEEARQAGRFDLLHDRQTFDSWKLGQQQAGMNTRQDKSIAAGKIGREYTQGEITKRSREGDQRKILKPYNDALNKMIPGGFEPLRPVLPDNLPKNGTPAVKPAQTKPQTPAKATAKAVSPAPKKQTYKGVKKGNTTVFDLSKK